MDGQDSVDKHLGLFRAKCALLHKEQNVHDLHTEQNEMKVLVVLVVRYYPLRLCGAPGQGIYVLNSEMDR